MQRKFNHTFTQSKMNKDLDARLISNDEYRDGQNVSVSRSEGSDVGALENILGNLLFNQLTSDTSGATSSVYLLQFIGWHIDEDTNKVYIFATDFQDSSADQISLFASPMSSHKIIVADLTSNTIATIVSGRFLNFSYNSPILDSAMIENQLFWTDNRNQPRIINVETAESDPNYYFHEDHVSLAKYYPHKPIQLFEEYSQAAMMVTTSALRTSGVATFDSIYPFFLFKTADMSAAMLAAITDNIGLHGYVKGNDNNNWEFKVAYVQQLSGLNQPLDAGAVAVFIDRDISSQVTAFTDPEDEALNYDVYFVDQTSKDVSSPWLREDQVKLKLESVSASNSYIYTSGASGNYDYAQALYKFGTRSPYNYLEDTTGGGAWSPFQIANYFPKNTGTAAIGYPRITHPGLDPNKYYVITSIADPAAASKSFGVSELSGFVGGTLTAVNSNLLFSAGDVVTVHWPNKYYNYNFPGDQKFLEDKFVRFSYRFRYDDGQCSVIAPFTQETFIPKQKGYFLKEINRQKSGGVDDNNYVPQEYTAGQNTIVDFMENEVTEVKLRIPCEYAVNTLANNLKVKEIEILYKESMGLSIKVAETLDIDDTSITSNSTNFLEYIYQSKQPIKTLRSSETTRVYDNVPVRAKTLTSSGNRVILGNFFDRHTSPENLAYYVSAGKKLTLGSTSQNSSNRISTNLPGKFSNVSYPNHTLKQNRTYQVGLILQDRYGRSSDVILSKFTDTNFTLQTGTFADNPQTFFGSTLYHGYLPSVTEPLTASPATKNVVNSGIVNWPGDSLKLLLTEQIPQTISYASGYPGLYEDPKVTASVVTSASFTNSKYIEITTGGSADSIVPGDLIQWTASGVDYEVVIQYAFNNLQSTGKNRYGMITQNGEEPTIVPGVAQSVDFIDAGNATGWYSYKVVVKQLEQDYYNVYLPSLLNGSPVIKPFDLTCTFVSGNKIATVDAVGTIENLTFPLLEGMKVVTPGGKTYYINNILNFTQFELTSAATASEASVEATFSTESSTGVLNVTTLLTDNANKVPPALNETTPVQQQYSTSDVELIPRLAELSSSFTIDRPYFASATTASGPVFPGLQTMKVQSIGNFENLFRRGSYNGLYNADTDPPTAIIQNTFNLGSDSQVAKPSSEAETLPAIYETTPTISNIEIYYETSTSGTVKELNTLIRDNLIVPTQFVTAAVGGTGTSPLGIVAFNESLQYSAAATIVEFQLVDQNGTKISYANATDLSVSTASYQNGTTIATAPFTVTEKGSDDIYLLKPTATNPMYSSGNAGLDNVSFNVTFNFLQFSVLPIPYSINLSTFVNNITPVFNTSRVNAAGTVYYVSQGLGTGAPISPGPTNWGNADGSNSTKSRATNGSNSSNANASTGITWELFVKSVDMFGESNFIPASSITGLSLSLIVENDYCNLSVGKYSEEYVTGNMNVEIRATDQSGNGLTTVISQFDLRLKES